MVASSGSDGGEHLERAAWAERGRAAESRRAAEAVSRFVEEARTRGLEPQPLRVRAWGGGATYRTPLRGWYLKRDHSVAVGEDGAFYALSAPASLRARLTGVRPEPTDPPLVVGAGGRDGESVPLEDLLRAVLERPA